MKKYLVLFLLFLPMMSYAAPSVRTLSGGKVATPASTTVKPVITPTRNVGTTASSGGESSLTTEKARLGALRAKTKVLSTSSASDSSVTRFPVIGGSGAYSYSNNNNTNSQSSGGTTTVITSGVTEDNPKFDAIKVGQPSGTAPDGYVFMWIETE